MINLSRFLFGSNQNVKYYLYSIYSSVNCELCISTLLHYFKELFCNKRQQCRLRSFVFLSGHIFGYFAHFTTLQCGKFHKYSYKSKRTKSVKEKGLFSKSTIVCIRLLTNCKINQTQTQFVVTH